MDQISGQCVFSPLSKIVFGPGSVEQLGAEMDRLGGRRVIIVTGKTLGHSPLLKALTDSLGDRCVAIFRDAAQHVPVDKVEALAEEIRKHRIDGVVSFGGGSPNDMAKDAIAAVISGRRVSELANSDFTVETDLVNSGEIPHICVPTTLSAGEYTWGAGVTFPDGDKRYIVNRRLATNVIINDPALTILTPDDLWFSTGIRCLDHTVETIYSTLSQSFTDALAAKALKLLIEHLPLSLSSDGDEKIKHRGFCQTAAWLSTFGIINAHVGLSHAIGHKIGPMWDIPHGFTSCIAQPLAMNYVASFAPERFEPIAWGLGIDFDRNAPQEAASECVRVVGDFIRSFTDKRTLKSFKVPREEIGKVVPLISDEIVFTDSLGKDISTSEVESLLVGMYE